MTASSSELAVAVEECSWRNWAVGMVVEAAELWSGCLRTRHADQSRINPSKAKKRERERRTGRPGCIVWSVKKRAASKRKAAPQQTMKSATSALSTRRAKMVALLGRDAARGGLFQWRIAL